MMLNSVDLPQPLGPISETNSLRRTDIVIGSSARTGPSSVTNVLEMPSSESTSVACGCGEGSSFTAAPLRLCGSSAPLWCTSGGRQPKTTEMSGLVVRRLALFAGFVFALSGCGGGGFVPGGPHSISSATLTRIVNDQSSVTKLPPRLIMAVIRTESGGDPSAISRAGAQGLMQLMPSTSMLYNVANPFDPASNVAG